MRFRFVALPLSACVLSMFACAKGSTKVDVLLFTATPAELGVGGGSTTLFWSTTGASSVSIDNGVGDVATTGTKAVTVTETTTFTLTAKGSSGAVTKTLTLTATTGQVYVDPVNGSDTNSGTKGAPWKTLKHAYGAAVAGQTIMLAGGVYSDASGEDFQTPVPDGIGLEAMSTGTATLQGTGDETALTFAGSGSAKGISILAFGSAVVATTGTLTLQDVTITNDGAAVTLSGDARMTANNVVIVSNVDGATGYTVSDFVQLTTSGGSVSGLGPNCYPARGLSAEGHAIVTMDGTNMHDILSEAVEAYDASVVTLKNATFDHTAPVSCGNSEAMDAFGYATLTWENVTLSNASTGVLIGGQASFSAKQSTLDTFSNAALVAFRGGWIILDSTTIQNSASGIYCENDSGDTSQECDFEITNSNIIDCTYDGIAGGGGSFYVKVRGTHITQSDSEAHSTAIDWEGDQGYIDLGTAEDPGGNVFQGNVLELNGGDADFTIPAAGNTWDVSVEGADSNGHYSEALVTGPASGQNYNIGASASIQF